MGGDWFQLARRRANRVIRLRQCLDLARKPSECFNTDDCLANNVSLGGLPSGRLELMFQLIRV